MAPSSLLPRLGGKPSARAKQPAPGGPVAPPPAVRVCPRCGFHNPGWAYLCDRCGANVRVVNVREAVAESKSRERYSITLLEAWGGALVFSRRWAFVPEVALASWRRSIVAVLSAALIASSMRIPTAVVVPVLVDKGAAGVLDLRAKFTGDVTLWGGQTLALPG